MFQFCEEGVMEMAMPQAGQSAPAFTLPSSNGKQVSLEDFRGKNVVLYFYPKDMTPGCTKESCEFRDYSPEFAALDTEIVGISPDDLTSHNQFISEYNLPFQLLSDVDHKVCELYGVWKLLTWNGKQFMGVERSTFLIDRQGTIVKVWRGVKVDGHVQEVLEAVRSLQR